MGFVRAGGKPPRNAPNPSVVASPIGGKPDFTLAIGGEKAYNKKAAEAAMKSIKEVRCVVSGDPFSQSRTQTTRRTR